jgi:IgA-specific serine endopeptidase
VLAEKLESALTATAVAESRARVAEAAAVAAEAAAVAAVERSLESHSARESTPVSRNRESETPQTSPRSSLPRSPSWGPPPGSSQQTPSFSPTRSSSFSTPKRQSTSVSPAQTRPEWGGSGSIKVDATNMDTREARGRVSLLERRVKTLEKALALSGAKLMTARDAAASAGDLLIETSQRLALLEQDAQRDAGKAQKGTERVGALEARALEAETNLASAQTKARDAETQVLAAEASSDAACAEQQRCRVAMDYAMADAATARDEADTLRAQLDNTTARLDQSETRCVDLAAQLDVWVERGFDVIRSSGSNAAERVVESGSPSEASRLNKHTPTIIGTPDWYAARFESPSLGARSGADAAKWAANAAAETPPLSLLRDLKDAAQSAIGEKTVWKLRAHEAEALVDSLVTTGEAAERATARDASAHEKALEAATQQTRDAETKADAAERRAVDAGRASSSRQKAARAEIAFLVTELAEARETAARAAADAAETRAKAHQRVASKLADAEKKAATAKAAAVAAESLAAAAETRARADVDAAERRAETRVSDLETKASRAVEDFEASKTRERETRAKLEVVRDDVSANKTARAEFEQRVVSLQNELLKTRAWYEEAHVLCRATEQRAETATREFAVAESKAADLTQALEATKTRLDRAVKLNVENEREIEQSRRDVSHLRREAGDAKEISKQFEAKADTLAKKVTALEAVLVTAEALFAAKARGKTRNANAETNTDSSPRPPGSVGSFEEATGGASDVLHLELVETKSALEETRAALREALRENNAGPARPQSPSTPLESASGDDAFSSGDDRGYVFGGARDVRTAQRRTRVDGRDELRVSKVLRRRNRNDTQNDDARKELEEMRLQLFAAAEREQNLRNVNRGLKRAAMAEAMALTGGHPETTGDGRNAPRVPQRDDGLRVAEAALESALLELTGG